MFEKILNKCWLVSTQSKVNVLYQSVIGRSAYAKFQKIIWMAEVIVSENCFKIFIFFRCLLL